MAERSAEKVSWLVLPHRWCWSAILLMCIGCQRPPADLPFHRFVEDVVPGQKWHEVKVPIRHETRNVLFAPYQAGRKLDLVEDTTITLGELMQVDEVASDSAGIRIQVYRWPAAGEKAGGDLVTRVYVPLPAERDAGKLAGMEVQIVAGSEAGGGVLALAREGGTLEQEHLTQAVRIPESARLDFGIGLEGDTSGTPLCDARFTIAVERGQERRIVFDQTLDRGSEGDVHGWIDATVDLSDLAGSTVRFVFRTEPGHSEDEKRNGGVVPLFDWSPVWSSPILYSTEAERIDGRPNIILISLDTLRADHLGCYGYHRDTSPNIDKFAEGAFLFENCIAPSPWTLPSHASVFTGLHPSAHRAEILCAPFSSSPGSFAEEETTFAELARERGYLTAAYTEGAFVSAHWGFAQGFESYSDGRLGPDSRARVEMTFGDALQWLDRYRELPFLLFVHTYQIHGPYEPPGRFATMFGGEKTGSGWKDVSSELDKDRLEALYDGEIAYTDEVCGTFFAELDKLGLMQDTVVIVFSDHGEEFLEHGHFQHGHSLYDELLRVPLLIKLAGEHPPRGRVSRQVSLTDVYATVLEVLGTNHESPPDCISLLPLFSGGMNQDVYERNVVVSERVWTPKDKETGELRERAMRSVRKDREKYIAGPRYAPMTRRVSEVDLDNLEGREELYNLRADPGEKSDIAADNEQGLIAYRALLDLYLKKVSAERAPLSASEQGVSPLTGERRRQLEALGYM